MSTTANYVKEINIPQNYSDYYEELSNRVYKEFETAADAKSTLLDSSGIIEPKIAFDLAERVAKMHDIDIATPLRELLDKLGKENAALIMSKEIAEGKYQSSDATLEDRLDHAVRVGLAIVTEGVTIAPLQGISEVKIKKNKYKLINYPKHYPADEPKRRCPDISKIKNHTKYRPIVSVSEGISRTLDYNNISAKK